MQWTSTTYFVHDIYIKTTRTYFFIRRFHVSFSQRRGQNVHPYFRQLSFLYFDRTLLRLALLILFSDQVVIWDGSEMPFKPVEASATTDYHIAKTMAVEDQMERIKKILDAKYSATDLEKVCSSQSHLDLEKQQKLLTLLTKFKDLFDGTLGKWNEEPVKLELKEDATPYHA
jgi:hypothetical protein